MKSTYEQLMIDIGLISTEDCTSKENAQYTQMLKNGEQLPEGIYKTDNIDYSSAQRPQVFLKRVSQIPQEKEQTYLLMKIFKDLHFIKVLFQTGVIISIITAIILICLQFNK